MNSCHLLYLLQKENVMKKTEIKFAGNNYCSYICSALEINGLVA